MTATAEPADRPRTVRGTVAWCLFDWANSPFPTVIVTFVFAVYFQRGIVGDPVRATELWGQAIALSALAVALAGPLLGAVADAGGPRKPWLLACTSVTVLCCALLWFARPEADAIWLALILVAVANFGFELGMVFYNAMLPGLTTPNRIGRLSGWAWALGFAGGLVCLVVALFGLIRAEPAPFGLSTEDAEPVRAVALLVAGWFVIFGWPLFAFTREDNATAVPLRRAIGDGFARLRHTLAHVRQYRQIVRFLIARMLYIDGLSTLFAFGGIYAAGTFGMTMSEVLEFGIALNVTAGLGAFAFAWVDDWLGAKRTTIISLICLMVLGTAILLVESKLWFWVLGLLIGIFMGPIQSASRSLMGRMAPADLRTEMFGLLALSGKATAFVGPWLVAIATGWFDSQRIGMATILLFFLAGLIILWPLREPGRTSQDH